MPEKGYFLKLGGAFLLGLLVLAVSLLLGWLLFPILAPVIITWVPALASAAMTLVVFFLVVAVIFAVIYFCTMLGVFLTYLSRPMQVSQKPGAYTIKKTREAGRRQRGRTRKKAK